MTRWLEPVIHEGQPFLPNFHPLIGQTLIARGITDEAAALAFLNPEIYIPAPASDLPGLSAAVERIIRAIQTGEPICVWGDFDVDGQTSTTVLVQSFRELGALVNYHIPIRQTESHGVNLENLEKVIDQGAKLVVTCDTGISSHAEVSYARSRGVDMIITDHHDLPDKLPDACAVVNPKMLPEDHPLATLAGVGVAYKLAEELIARLQPKNFLPDNTELIGTFHLLDLVALGLVADLAILRGDARYLVQKGLAELRQTKRLGLKIIMELAEVSAANLTEEHIGFALGPRLNAIGRLGDANSMVELLTTNDASRARVLAVQLESLNAQRKLECDQVLQAAEAQLRANPELLAQPVIILAHPLWPGGIVGIVASNIVERYHKPAILLTAPPGQPVRGSARSIEGVNITAAIAAQKELLIGFGGHPMAAGLSLEAEKLPEFRRKIAQTVERMLGGKLQQEGSLQINSWIGLEDANLELAEQLESLAPFGPGNAKLILASHNLGLKSSTKLGKTKEHLKVTVVDENGSTGQVLWWDGGSEENLPSRFDLAYSLRASDWHGSRQAQLEFVDFRALEVKEVALARKKLEIIDYRTRPNPQGTLIELMGTFHTELMGTFHTELMGTFHTIEKNAGNLVCWAEAEEKKRVGGQDRSELIPAQTLIIWTTPPSRQELLSAMAKVNPEKVIVFAIDPGFDEPQAMLDRLAGLVKFVLNKKSGKTSLSQLAAALAQREIAVRLGLECLSQNGSLTLDIKANGDVLLTDDGKSSLIHTESISTELKNCLNEGRSYRKHFREQTEINLT